jgi:hypothetical protein
MSHARISTDSLRNQSFNRPALAGAGAETTWVVALPRPASALAAMAGSATSNTAAKPAKDILMEERLFKIEGRNLITSPLALLRKQTTVIRIICRGTGRRGKPNYFPRTCVCYDSVAENPSCKSGKLRIY